MNRALSASVYRRFVAHDALPKLLVAPQPNQIAGDSNI
jgi:hypothetical protein